jgi:hypothetical protein
MPPPLKKGDRRAVLELRDLSGGTADLATLGSRRTMLLFWNPSCGFCETMLDDVKAWERSRAKDAPQLVVISGGSPKANREQGFSRGCFWMRNCRWRAIWRRRYTICSDRRARTSGVRRWRR